MHLDILTYIILPNVGYWKGTEIVSKKQLNYTKNLLNTSERKEYSRGNCCELHRSRKYKVLEYKIDGLFHREDDLPAREWNYGYKEWYKKGKLHRDGDLPAIEYGNGHKEWRILGNLHRDGGLPAIICSDGAKEWWINGIKQKRCVIS